MATGSIVGLTLAKINGIYELDVTNAAWDDARTLAEHFTGAGLRLAAGLESPSGTFDEVVSKQGATNWRNLDDFTLQIYDKETRKIVVASFEGCKWANVGGSSDTQSAQTKKKISWKGTGVVSV